MRSSPVCALGTFQLIEQVLFILWPWGASPCTPHVSIQLGLQVTLIQISGFFSCTAPFSWELYPLMYNCVSLPEFTPVFFQPKRTVFCLGLLFLGLSLACASRQNAGLIIGATSFVSFLQVSWSSSVSVVWKLVSYILSRFFLFTLGW